MPLYVIEHIPSKTYFPIGERGRLRDAMPLSVPFDGPPRVFNTEHNAQNSLRWWKGRLMNTRGRSKKFFKELQIVEIKFEHIRTVKYIGTRM